MNATQEPVTQPAAAPGKIQKVIVAIHGIGDQKRNETIQTATARFCDYCGFPAFTPLGQFSHQVGSGVSVFVLREAPKDSPLAELAFAEVYWAAIPRKVIADGYLLEEPKKWGRALVERLRYTVKASDLSRFNFPMLHQVVPQIIETIYVLERVGSVGRAAGLFDVSLKKVLQDYLGDVQVVADFPDFRREILQQFNHLMAEIQSIYAEAEIYLIAHSEGTVVSWLGLLEALSSESPPEWTRKVRGYMTIGSPIDKHLILWPALFEGLQPRARIGDLKIQWRNYYDYGDPVGFELDTARDWMGETGFDRYFEFDGERHDLGFTRYYLPGKAHTDYWADEQVFGHFIGDVVKIPPLAPKCTAAPKSRRTAQVVSYAGAYLLPLALLLIGFYVLYKQSGMFIYPDTERGIFMIRDVLGIGALLAGLTVFARIPRLVMSVKWQAIGFGIFLAGCAAYAFLVHEDTRTYLGYWPERLKLNLGFSRDAGVLVFSLLLASLMFFVSKKWPKAGMKAIIFPGVIALLFLAGAEHHANAEDVKVWPLLLAGAFFFYLWWLAALLFDLIFVWHRYIRFSGLEQLCHAVGRPQRRKGSSRPKQNG